MPTDHKKEWMEKASIDYFSPFISLWLACNSWYMFHYSDLNDNHAGNRNASDRDYINKLKEDFGSRNHLYKNFEKLITDGGKKGIAFRTDIELLHYSLQRVALRPEKISSCSFCHAVINFNDYSQNNQNFIDLIKNPRITRNGKIISRDQNDVIKLDKIYISSNLQHCFAGIFEIIYQVRNMLVHGRIKPEKETHNVVKYCYQILWSLMSDED